MDRVVLVRGGIAVAIVATIGLVWVASVGFPEDVPAFHGRVVDAATGRPLEGALIGRVLYTTPELDLVDTKPERSIAGTYVEVKTGADGRFEFPKARAARVVAMGWWEWKSGWMPGQGCYRREGWREGGCGGFGGLPLTDPWVELRVVDAGALIELEVRVLPPVVEGARFRKYDPRQRKFVSYIPKPGDIDPWGEYFDRLRRSTQVGRLPEEEFVREAIGYVAHHHLTEGVLLPLAELTGAINPLRRPGLSTQYCSILAAITSYCQFSPESKRCAWPTVALCVREHSEDCGGQETGR